MSILVVNNNSLEDFPYFCFDIKITSCRRTRGPRALNLNSIICSMSVSPSYFFFSNAFFSVKTSEMDGGELSLKTVRLRLITMLLLRPDLHCAGPLAL